MLRDDTFHPDRKAALFQDVRFGLRLLRREPGFASTTVLTLTLAIGATTTIFSVVDAVLLQAPPFPEPDRLVTLWQTDPNNANRPVEPAPANFLDWREQATSFEQVAAVEPFSFDFTGDGAPEVFYASLVTEGFFEVLGSGAALGRTFLPEEFQPGSGVVLLTHGFWERRFGGDAGILGRSLTLDGQPYTVAGGNDRARLARIRSCVTRTSTPVRQPSSPGIALPQRCS